MNIVEMYQKCKEIFEANENNHFYIGLRFEDKKREIGDVCENSKHNADREDERDFPEFGSDDYEEMEELDGTSAWNMAAAGTYKIDPWALNDLSKNCTRHFTTEHCYVIASNKQGRHDDPDQGEILIKDAVVIAQIF